MLHRAADRVAAIYHANAHRVYQTGLGTSHPTAGSFQLVFCDLSTPKGGRDDTAYDRFRAVLVSLGVPGEKVRFVHEHDRNDEDKARFFAACRDGRIAVAISSTAKMGMGTNVQDRLIAEHHLDVPWRPSDVEQREGRILRQGNQNPVVEVFAYAAERSFSVYGWQTLERKAGFIGQLMRAEPNGPRSLEVHDDEALSYGEVKAIVTGDPAFLELARLEDTLAGLERLQRSHAREQAGLSRRVERLEDQLARTRSMIEALAPHAAAVETDRGTPRPWRVTIGDKTFDNRGDAATALAPLLGYAPRRVLSFPDSGIEVGWQPGQYGVAELVADVGLRDVAVKVEERSHDALIGALTRITNVVERLPERMGELRARESDISGQLKRSGARVGEAFAKTNEVRETRKHLDELREELTKRYGSEEQVALSGPVERSDREHLAEEKPAGVPTRDRVEPDRLIARDHERGFADAGEEAAAFQALYPPHLSGPSISIN